MSLRGAVSFWGARQLEAWPRRAITSGVAIAVARQMVEQGLPGIEERDGRLWALGFERRTGDRRGES